MNTAVVSAVEIRIITSDAAFAMSVAVSLRSTPYQLTVIDRRSSRLSSATSHAAPPAAAVVELTGETVVEMRELLRSWHAVRCLFVVRDMPLGAPLARIVKQHGGAILSKDEPPIVITARLIAMMTDARSDEVQ